MINRMISFSTKIQRYCYIYNNNSRVYFSIRVPSFPVTYLILSLLLRSSVTIHDVVKNWKSSAGQVIACVLVSFMMDQGCSLAPVTILIILNSSVTRKMLWNLRGSSWNLGWKTGGCVVWTGLARMRTDEVRIARFWVWSSFRLKVNVLSVVINI